MAEQGPLSTCANTCRALVGGGTGLSVNLEHRKLAQTGGVLKIPTYGVKHMRIKAAFAIAFAILFTGSIGAAAQEVSGTPGSPSATTTIDGRQIPPLPGQFGRSEERRVGKECRL